MKSQFEQDKNKIKQFHYLGYYKSTQYNIKDQNFLDKERQRLKITKEQKVIDKIDREIKRTKYEEENKVFKILENIYIKNQEYSFCITKKKPINSDLINIISDISLLTVGYKKVTKNKRSIAESYIMSKEKYDTLKVEGKSSVSNAAHFSDEMNQNILQITSQLIKTNRYQWGTSRRLYLDKPGQKNKKRPITISTLMDKVVQESITTILNSIYEPYFEKQNVSFAFRPNKGVHDAIIKLTGAKAIGLHMALEGNIKSAYDKVDGKILIQLLEKKLHDRKTIKFIEKRLGYEIYDTKKNTCIKEKEGLPQGGVDSLYLWNIYMMELDEFIVNHLNEKFKILNKKKIREKVITVEKRSIERQRTIIKKIINWIKKRENKNQIIQELDNLTKKGAKDLIKNKDFEVEITGFKKNITEANIGKEKDIRIIIRNLIQINNKLRKKWRKLSSRDPIKIELRFVYTRYANEWIILTNAKKKILENIKQEITEFLKDKLKVELSQEKNLIINIKENSAHFLGFEIKTYKERSLVKYKKITNKKTKIITAVTAGYIVFAIPDRQRLLNRLHMKGYCDKNGFPREMRYLSNLDDFTIIERYNSVITGLSNYYAEFIKNPIKNLSRWIYIIRFSCLKTLAQKHKTSLKQILKKYNGVKIIGTENTVAVTVRNIIEDSIDEKILTLKTLKSTIKKSIDLKIKPRLNDINWRLEKGNPVQYESKDKNRITNDDFYEKIN